MKRIFVILALLGSPAYAVPVVPNFSQKYDEPHRNKVKNNIDHQFDGL